MVFYPFNIPKQAKHIINLHNEKKVKEKPHTSYLNIVQSYRTTFNPNIQNWQNKTHRRNCINKVA